MTKPNVRPNRPQFSSGPTVKRPGWDINNLDLSALGRSHRSDIGKKKLQQIIELSKDILGIPKDYVLGIVPASDTGAVEMALWNLLGSKPVDILSFDAFGQDWLLDIQKELRLEIISHAAPYGQLPDLQKVDFTHDLVFTWNGTTSGVRIPDGEWIAAKRTGLTICDATSAIFAMELPWEKLDVITWSWQKALGGEAAHGMLALSPRAIQRLTEHQSSWPIPKIFRLKKSGKVIDSIFAGETINTPSMLAAEDQLDALSWAQSIGGLPALVARAKSNLRLLEEWQKSRPWISFLAEDPHYRSPTSVCFTLDKDIAKNMATLLAVEKVAFDIASYRDAPPGLRIWSGPTVESADIENLLPWLDWAYEEVRGK